ncbi:nuclear pore component-domain-containing protein [Entophlyctis helioformis]|nr:nuclear pore component-domain-containing protein [Entophlyctis helioformis]
MAQADGHLFLCTNTTAEQTLAGVMPAVRVASLRDWKKLCVAGASGGAGALDPSAPDAGAGAGAEPAVDPQMLAEAASWKELVLPGLDFPVRQLSINATGKLLVLAGDRRILVAILPISIHANVPSLECKTHPVGSILYAADRANHIAKVAWLPLSDTATHLAVLSSNARLRIFDIAANQANPEQAIRLDSRAAESGGGDDDDDHLGMAGSTSLRHRTNAARFGASLDEHEAVSFSFGSSHDARGWGSFTVYALMRNGDIVSVCPVVPGRLRVPLQLIHNLKQETDIEWRDADPAQSTEQSSHFYWRSKWLQELLDQAPNQPGVLSGDIVGRKPVGTAKLALARRGPYLVQPSAASIELDQASDLVYIPTPSAAVLAVASTDGHIAVYLELDPPCPNWHMHDINASRILGSVDDPEQDEQSLPALAWIEMIDLGLQQSRGNTAVVLAADPKHRDVVYAYHSHGVHSITLGCYAGLLEVDDTADECMDQQLGNSIVRHIAALSHTSSDSMAENTTVVGLAVISEIYLGYSLVLLTSDHQLFGEMLTMRAPAVVPGLASPSHRGKKAPAPAAFQEQTPSALEGHLYKLPAIFQGAFPRRPKLVGSAAAAAAPGAGAGAGYPMFINAQTLVKASEHIAAIRDDLRLLYNAKHDMVEHVQRQVQENTMQIEKLSDIAARVQKQEEHQQRIMERAEQLRERQQRIAKKLDVVLQIVIDETQPALSAAEIQWANELRQKELETRGDLNVRIEQARDRAAAVVAQYLNEAAEAREVRRQREKTKTEMLGSGQMRRLREALVNEYQVINHAAEKVEALQQEVEALEAGRA